MGCQASKDKLSSGTFEGKLGTSPTVPESEQFVADHGVADSGEGTRVAQAPSKAMMSPSSVKHPDTESYVTLCDLTLRKIPHFQEKLTACPATTVVQGSIVTGEVMRGMDGGMHIKLVITTPPEEGSRHVYCFLPLHMPGQVDEPLLLKSDSVVCEPPTTMNPSETPPTSEDGDAGTSSVTTAEASSEAESTAPIPHPSAEATETPAEPAEEAIPTQEDKKAGAHTAEQNDEAVDDYAIAAMEVRGRNQLQYKSPRQDFYGFGECEEASDDEDESGEYETDESEEEASVYTESTSVSPTNSLGKMKRACAWG